MWRGDIPGRASVEAYDPMSGTTDACRPATSTVRSRHRTAHDGAGDGDCNRAPPTGRGAPEAAVGVDVCWVMRRYVPAPGAACTPARSTTAQGPTPHPGRSSAAWPCGGRRQPWRWSVNEQQHASPSSPPRPSATSRTATGNAVLGRPASHGPEIPGSERREAPRERTRRPVERPRWARWGAMVSVAMRAEGAAMANEVWRSDSHRAPPAPTHP